MEKQPRALDRVRVLGQFLGDWWRYQMQNKVFTVNAPRLSWGSDGAASETAEPAIDPQAEALAAALGVPPLRLETEDAYMRLGEAAPSQTRPPR